MFQSGKKFRFVAIVAAVLVGIYWLAPDFCLGPIDDAVVTILGAVLTVATQSILAFAQARMQPAISGSQAD